MILGPLKLFLRLLAAVVGAVVIYFFVGFLQIWMTSHEHSKRDADAILVFGTAEDNGKPSAELKARLTEALTLYQHHRAPWVVVTGGKQKGDVYTEAGVSARWLEARGVPADRIIKGAGVDTWQNVASVVAKLYPHHIVSVLCVTDPFHEYRAMAIASGEGLTPYPEPVSHSPASSGSIWYYFRESIAVGVGRIVGYHTLSSWTTNGPSVTWPRGGP
ncbi:MAG TPA: YdcF family protein [Acidimicrobiales bacterium]|nr:YdcF family protein [Acidimicrobiales bacterium]